MKDGRPSILDEHKPHLHQRWNEGCTNVTRLHAELKERGYKGSYGTIRDYMLPFREAGTAPPAVPGPPKARDLARWITADPDNLDDDEKAKLAEARERCPHLNALAGHVTEFAKILTGRHGDHLDAWITAVEADDQPDLHSFVRGIKRDYDAVLNGLTMAVELRRRGRQRQPGQDAQAPDLRPRRVSPAPQARAPGQLTGVCDHHEIRARSK